MIVPCRGFGRDIGALEEVFRFMGEFVAQERIGERTAFCLDLVVEELFTNMVRHNRGGGEQITVSLERDGDCVLLRLVDTDVEPFDPASAEAVPVDAGIEDRRPGGLGLHLVRSMVDGLVYDYDDVARRMKVSVTKRLER